MGHEQSKGALSCYICSAPVSQNSRRSICFQCKKVVCKKCSEKTSPGQGYGNLIVRICNPCIEKREEAKY